MSARLRPVLMDLVAVSGNAAIRAAFAPVIDVAVSSEVRADCRIATLAVQL